MANHKPPRTDNDIQALAARWRTEWTPHDGIEPWLRRHLTDLTTLNRNDRWSWNDLAHALNEARILYATGRPWSGRRLCDKVNRLRVRQRRAAVALDPRDLIATVREALEATGGNFNTINISLAGAVAPSSAPARIPTPAPAPEHQSSNRAPASAPVVTPAAASSEPRFRPARLRNDGRGVSVEERRALGDPTVPADPDESA